MKQTRVMIPTTTLDQADDLAELMEDFLGQGYVTRSTVLRMALVRGLRVLAAEVGAEAQQPLEVVHAQPT